MNREEYKIQVAIVEHHATAFHPAAMLMGHQTAVQDSKQGFFNKQMGVIAGTHDLQILWRDSKGHTCVGFIEVKSEDGRISTPQNKFASAVSLYGAKTGSVRSVREYHNLLVSWGLSPRHNSIQEPNLMTKEEKFEAVRQMYAPPSSGDAQSNTKLPASR